jgi:DNA modification methylase
MDGCAVTLFVNDTDFQLYVGDVREQLAQLPDESVHCVVTSPPYWGLRDYGTGAWDGGDPDCDHLREIVTRGTTEDRKGWQGAFRATAQPLPMAYSDVCGKCGATRVDQQLGLEATPDLFVAAMVEVFREVRRVLRRDGTCWVNLGDSYASQGGPLHPTHGLSNIERTGTSRETPGQMRTPVAPGMKPKDLCGIPWRVAFALQADGWYLRSDIIWSKPNPMPESVTDRPTKAHEYVFLLTRSPRYFFDQEAVREPHNDKTGPVERFGNTGKNGGYQGGAVSDDMFVRPDLPKAPGGRVYHPAGRNIRSVWEIATQPYPEAHFATFPEALPERCIKAGTSERGCCPECGAPWERVTSTDYDAKGRTTNGPRSLEQRHETAGFAQRLEKRVETTGWRPGCGCGTGQAFPPIACTVLEPFMGSGTTALVARRLGRRSIGVELSPDYARICAKRLQQLSLFAGEPA